MSISKAAQSEFLVLISQHQGIIHRICRVYTDMPQEREDLFQEICLQLWRSYPTFRGDSKFSTWLYRVALNTAIGTIRKKKYLLNTEPLAGLDQAEEHSTSREENRIVLYRAISRLSRIDKAIILLWLEDHQYQEIANIMGVSKSAISVKLVRIRKKLSAMINQKI